jgi:hypothetical protein
MVMKNGTSGPDLYPYHVVRRYVYPPKIVTIICAWQVRLFLSWILFVCLFHDLISFTPQDFLQGREFRDVIMVEEIHDRCSHRKSVTLYA